MSKETKIQWTDATWNVGRGCSKVDADCLYCYMYRDSLNGTRYNPKVVEKTKTVFNAPLKWKEPKRIFTSSLTDFFHEDIDAFRLECFDIIRRCPQHTFQVLTKRPERVTDCLVSAMAEAEIVNYELFMWLREWIDGSPPMNVWLGTSVGSQQSIGRIEHLLEIPARVRFLSIEPLWAEVNIDGALWRYTQVSRMPRIGWDAYDKRGGSPGIEWVIVGGESGNDNGKYRYRPCELAWIERVVEDCKTSNIPVFVKQLGTHLAKQLKLSDRHGGNIDEFPPHLQIRQFPLVEVNPNT